MSSVTWPFKSQWTISYWWSIGPKSLSPSVFEIFGPKYIEVTTLTILGNVTSSITWPFESQLVISYWWSIVGKSLSPWKVAIFTAKVSSLRESTSFEPFCVKIGWGSDLQAWAGKKSQKVSDSHRNDVSPLTQGLRYRSACDVSYNHQRRGDTQPYLHRP